MVADKKPDFNILLFLFLYFFLKYAFYFYIGLTTPGGKLYLAVLNDYANFPYWLTLIVSKSSAFLLHITGYNVYQKDAANITIAGSKGVTIAWGCLGVGAMVLWIGFITAHRKFSSKHKLKWIIYGVVLIFLINMLRIDMIALSNYYGWTYFQSFNAHTSFDILTYAIILIMMLVFAIYYNRKKVRIDNA